MSNRILGAFLGVTLVGFGFTASGPGGVAPAHASESERTFFLTSSGCPSGDDNVDRLSLTNVDDAVECFYTAAGARNEIGENVVTTPGTPDRESATRHWDAMDGIPIVLDASKPITGELWTQGGACVLGGVPCSPAGLSAGEVILDLTFVGTTGGSEVEIATFTDEFNVVPGAPQLTEVEAEIDGNLDGKKFDTIELQTWVHGMSAGHGVIKTTGETSSNVVFPVKQEQKKAKKAKKNPPGQGVRQCNRIKNKKKRQACKRKARQADKGCAAYEPGEMGAEVEEETTIVTDAATEEEPIEMEFDFGPAGGSWAPAPVDTTEHIFHNVQIDSEAEEVGFWAKLTTPPLEDPDLYVYWDNGTVAAQATGFNPLLVAGPVPFFDGTGNGGHSGFDYEQIDGIGTADCTGYTLDLVNWLGFGGTYTLTLWLGDIENEANPRDG